MRRLYHTLMLATISLSSFATTNRLIIKYKPTTTQLTSIKLGTMSTMMINKQLAQPLSTTTLSTLSQLATVSVKELHSIATGAHVLQLSQTVDSTKLQQIINNIKNNPSVDYVVEDRILKPTTLEINPVQWDMQANDTSYPTWFGNNFTGAWTQLESGVGNGVVVAVVDTGYTPHTNFISNLQATPTGQTKTYGYQFISDCRIAGNCLTSTTTNTDLSPQVDALDRGDYLTTSDVTTQNGFFYGYNAEASSWHGTHVTGTIIGQGYSGSSGVLGGAYNATVLPVRVIGKGGGYLSDIEAGMLWATGLDSSIPNLTPAKVINLSLGGSEACQPDEQEAINQITNAGGIVVVAAGNSGQDVSTSDPANCANVISVAANGPTKLAYYSNYGNTTITASGGDAYYGTNHNTNNATGQIYSTLWSSLTEESLGISTYGYMQGTSMATPHVSAAIADIIGALTSIGESYSLTSITQILQNTASYNSAQQCNSYGCAVSGTMNVESAIIYALNITPLSPSTNNVTFGGSNSSSQTITFTNENKNSITIESTTITGSTTEESLPSIASTTCSSGLTLSQNESCKITLAWQSSSSGLTALLQLTSSSNNNVIATVTINNDGSTVTTITNPISSGGGCSMIQNGDDASLSLLLAIILIIGTLRYYIPKRAKR